MPGAFGDLTGNVSFEQQANERAFPAASMNKFAEPVLHHALSV